MASEPATTTLVLLRHGDAGDPLPSPELDTRRPLTPRGRKQARRAGKALARLGLAPTVAYASRLRRASETLAVALEACGGSPHVVRTAALTPDAEPTRAVRLLATAVRADHVPAPPAVAPSDAAGTSATSPAGAGASHAGAPPAPAPVRWLVGHDPHLTRLLAHLLGAAPEALRLSKGAFAVVSLDARGPAAGAGTLVGLVPADALKALTRKKKKKKHGKRTARKDPKPRGAR